MSHHGSVARAIPMTQMTFEPSAEGGVTVDEIVRTRFGEKAVLGGDTYEAKEAIKSLPWDDTHRTFDGDLKAWTVDADALEALEEALEDHGFTLVSDDWVDAMIDDIREAANITGEPCRWVPFDIRVEVDYEAKKSGKEMAKEGIVTGAEDGELYFRRDDGRTNRVTADGLYSSGYYPYMGDVTAVRVEIPPEDDEAELARMEIEAEAEMERRAERAFERGRW